MTYSHPFYSRPEWRRLRYRVLRKWGFRCMACRNARESMHVDHIKSISKFPELALDEDNCQVLCPACNLGKSNIYHDDLRPKPEPSSESEDARELRRVINTITEAATRSPGRHQQARLMGLLKEVQSRRARGQIKAALSHAVMGLCDIDLGEIHASP